MTGPPTMKTSNFTIFSVEPAKGLEMMCVVAECKVSIKVDRIEGRDGTWYRGVKPLQYSNLRSSAIASLRRNVSLLYLPQS
jgi:hypothetical protein